MSSKFVCDYCDKNHNSLENLNRHITCDQTCDRYKDVYFFCYDCKEYMTKGHTYIKKHKISGCKRKDKNYLSNFKDIFFNQFFDKHYELISDMRYDFSKQLESQNKIILDLQNEIQNLRFSLSKSSSSVIEEDEKIKKYRKPNSKYIEIVPQKNRDVEIEEISKIYDIKRQTSTSVSEAKLIFKKCLHELPDLKFEGQQTAISCMKKIRLDIFKVTPYEDYKKLVDEHIKNLTEFYKTSKNYQDKRLNNYLLKSLSSIESRILFFTNYHTIPLERDEINLLESCLEFSGNLEKEYVVFSNNHFLQKFHNFGSVVLSIKNLIKTYLLNAYGFNNYIYLIYKKNNEDDPYTFYKLDKIEKGVLHWEIDCRAENLTNSFISDVLPYLSHIFRRIYRDIFHDNIYRKNYGSTNSVTENECEQLLRNIFILSDQRTFCDIFRKIIKEHANKNAEDNDKFSMFGDDSIQREKFASHKFSTDSTLNIISTLFDDISLEDAVDLMREKYIT